jgi:Protein of unknown function (DUF1552)
MRSYRFARRSFMAGVGGAVGLKVMLRNMEAMAQGATSPPRFFMTHFPVGTLRVRFMPSGSGSTYVASTIIKPFEDAGLRNDMTVFYNFTDAGLSCPGGGGHEAGTPFTTTACSAEGTRQNGGETDDGVAGGPSFDQVFLKNIPALARSGTGYANAICDARVDSNETSTQCLSYSYTSRSISAANPAGRSINEYTPLLPQLSPALLYTSLFGSFMPGGATAGNQQALLKALKLRKSVLDFSTGELNELKRLAPSGEAPKIDLHAAAIRKVEQQLAEQIENGGSSGGTCTVPTKPADGLTGKKGNDAYRDNVNADDAPTHQAVAEAHSAVLLGAFQCDIIRVATFQFSPGTNHVSFKGLWPSDPNRIAMHHPVSHAGAFLGGAAGQDPSGLGAEDKNRYDFLCNVQTWYNTRLADMLKKMKTMQDAFGGNLLDYSVVPYITEVAQSNHSRAGKPAFLFGGTKLGLKHGTFQNFSQARPQVDLYLTCAQALMKTADPKAALSAERFNQFNRNAAVIPGLWSAPA